MEAAPLLALCMVYQACLHGLSLGPCCTAQAAASLSGLLHASGHEVRVLPCTPSPPKPPVCMPVLIPDGCPHACHAISTSHIPQERCTPHSPCCWALPSVPTRAGDGLPPAGACTPRVHPDCLNSLPADTKSSCLAPRCRAWGGDCSILSFLMHDSSYRVHACNHQQSCRCLQQKNVEVQTSLWVTAEAAELGNERT